MEPLPGSSSSSPAFFYILYFGHTPHKLIGFSALQLCPVVYERLFWFADRIIFTSLDFYGYSDDFTYVSFVSRFSYSSITYLLTKIITNNPYWSLPFRNSFDFILTPTPHMLGIGRKLLISRVYKNSTCLI
jgi:hypothetical protein